VAARKFDPARHPRDRFGRFTKSRTVKASAKDKAAAREVAEGFQPQAVGRQERAAYLQRIAGSQPTDAFGDVLEANKALRSGKDSDAAERLKAAAVELPDDMLLSRAVPLSVFGRTDPQSLQGMKVRDAGFAPAQLGTVRPVADHVRMHMAVPAGTRAVVNPETGEIALDHDTEMVVAKVAVNDAGGVDMWLTVLPKQSVQRSEDDGEGGDKTSPTADGEAVEADDAGRAELMKLKLPELRERMRERGLKPGRMRKSQMVDALVADETGNDEPAGDTPPEPEPQAAPDPGPASVPGDQTAAPATDARSFDERIKAAAKGRKALDAMPLSLLPRSRGNPDLTPERAKILRSHLVGETGDIDRALQKGGDTPKATADRVAVFDGIMQASPLGQDAVYYRGASTTRGIFGDAATGDLTGHEWVEHRFAEVSPSDQTAQNMAGGRGAVLRILAPQGTGAAAISGGASQEVLLDRGHTWRVVKDSGPRQNAPRLIDVEIVPKTGDEPARIKPVEVEVTTADNPLSAEQVAALPDTPLGRSIASGVASSKTLSGGAVGDVRLVTFGDGSKAIQKIAKADFAGSSQTDLTDGEVLAGRLGRAIGAPVPEVVHTRQYEIFMEYVPAAKPGMAVLNRYTDLVERAGKWEEFVDSRDGRLLGVLDLVTANADRHAGNWLVRKDGTITGIDHGLVWSKRLTGAPDVRSSNPEFDSPFAGRFFGDNFSERRGWQPNDLSPADVLWMRRQAEGLREEFDRRGRGDWLDFTLTRIDQLGEYARGTTDRVAT